MKNEEKMLLSKAKRELERRYGYSGVIGINYIVLEDRILARAFFKSTRIRRILDNEKDKTYKNYLITKSGLILIDDGVFVDDNIYMELVPHKEVIPIVRKIN